MRSTKETVNSYLNCWVRYGNKSRQWPQIIAIAVAALGSFMNGAIVNWTSPAIPVLISNASHVDPITLEEASYFTVIPTISTVIVSPVLAILVDKIGRKKTIMFISVTYFLSWTSIAFAEHLYIFYLARFIQGMGDAAVFTAIPMYVGEISEPKIRGTWGNLIAFSMFFGFFMVNTVGAYCNIRTSAIIFGAVMIAHFFLMVFMPESPYFLIMRNRKEEARSSLKMLRWMENVEDELAALTKDVQKETAEAGRFKDLLINPTIRKTMILSIGLRASQPFTGLPVFTMYTQYMFSQAGSALSDSTSAMIFSGVFTLTIAALSPIVERFGRKSSMALSCLGCGICLVVETVYFYIYEETNINISAYSWIPLAGMLTYIPICSAGLSTIPTIMLGELFPTSVKGIALCFLNVCFSFFLLLVTKLFQILSSTFGMYVPFCLFSVCCFLNVIFAIYFLPETKGKTLEEIQDTLKGRKNVKQDTPKCNS